MADQYKNMMIALFICAAAGVITFILLFIHPSVGDEQKKLRVRFSDIDKVSVGTRVTYGGKPVGEVVGIREIADEKNHRETQAGKVYLYELELRVDSGVQIFNSDEVSQRTSGLLGEKSVAIIPLPPLPGQKLRNVDKEVLYAKEVGSVEETFKEFKEITNKFEQVLDNVNRILEQMDHDKTFKSIARIANNVSDITDALAKPQQLGEILDSVQHLTSEASAAWHRIDVVIDNLNIASNHVKEITGAIDQPTNLAQTLENAHEISRRAASSWDTIELALNDLAETTANTKLITQAVNQPKQLEAIVQNTYQISDNLHLVGPKIDQAVDAARETFNAFTASANEIRTTFETAHVALADVHTAVKDVNGIIAHVYSGEGTLGHLFMRDDLYLRLTALLNKAEVVANDVNHYGLLFHLDKGWQRLRARRLNLLAKLSTPQQFRNYFNDEIDQVTTSLARVEMVLDKNATLYPCGLLLDDNEFAKVYAGLLRRVEGMEEALKLYNQQLVDQQLEITELVPLCQ